MHMGFGGLRGRGARKQDAPIERELTLSLEEVRFSLLKIFSSNWTFQELSEENKKSKLLSVNQSCPAGLPRLHKEDEDFPSRNERGRADIQHPRQDPHDHREARLAPRHTHHFSRGGRPGTQQHTRCVLLGFVLSRTWPQPKNQLRPLCVCFRMFLLSQIFCPEVQKKKEQKKKISENVHRSFGIVFQRHAVLMATWGVTLGVSQTRTHGQREGRAPHHVIMWQRNTPQPRAVHVHGSIRPSWPTAALSLKTWGGTTHAYQNAIDYPVDGSQLGGHRELGKECFSTE